MNLIYFPARINSHNKTLFDWFNRATLTSAFCVCSLFVIPTIHSLPSNDCLKGEIFGIQSEASECDQILRKKSKASGHKTHNHKTHGRRNHDRSSSGRHSSDHHSSDHHSNNHHSNNHHSSGHVEVVGKAGPVGVAGLLDFAAYEWAVAPSTIPQNIHSFQPLRFLRERAQEGNAIQSSFPYDSFTLAPGDYEVHVGLANNGGPTGPAKNLQLELFINSQREFIWPALEAESNPASPFVSFATLIHTEGSSSLLQIIVNQDIVYDETETGGTVAYINIFKINPEETQCPDRD